MTLEEFREADEEPGYRFELARGVLEVTEVPDDLHRQVVTNLYEAASRYRRDHPGVVLAYGGGAEFRLWLPAMISGRNPDFGVVLHGTPRDHRGRRNPALVAEVVSLRGGERDYQVKRQEYLVFGILEYWIVDPRLRQVTLLTREGDTWAEQVLRDHEVIPSLVLPGLATTVADLWADVDDDPGPEHA
jgi:Uma2 family endonuclease